MIDCEQLISKVHEKSAIWDRRDNTPINRVHVDKCWKMISLEMKIEEEKLRKKWKYLRDQFKIEFTKIKRPRSGEEGGVKDTSKWRYFNSLIFLQDVVKLRQSVGNLRSSASDSSESPALSRTQQLEGIERDADLTESFDEQIQQGHNFTVNRPLGKRIKHQRMGQFATRILEIERRKVDIIEKKHRSKISSDSQDSNAYFLKSLQPHMNRICPENTLKFQMRILEVVQEFAYGNKYLAMEPECARVQGQSPTASVDLNNEEDMCEENF